MNTLESLRKERIIGNWKQINVVITSSAAHQYIAITTDILAVQPTGSYLALRKMKT